MKYIIVTLISFLFSLMCFAQPVSNNPQVIVKKLLTIPNNGVRVAIDKNADRMYFITSHDNPKTNNEIYEVLNFRNPNPTYSAILADKNNHGMTEQMTGLAIHQGVMYVCGSSDFANSKVVGYIKKTTLPITNSSIWTTVMESAPYNKSNSAFDHRMSELTIDPTGEYLYLNSGSKSDHGEMNNGERDVALTAKIFRIPINAVNLILPNDNTNAPYVFADGTRNSFGLAFDANGNLFGTENGGDRDHNEELNWLRKGHHYGFPWRIGGSNNPQQYSNYQPGISNGQWFNNTSLDFMIQKDKSVAWVQYKSFKNDPTFPQIPDGFVFTEAVVNLGPHADLYRDTTNFYSQASSIVKDASTVAGSKMTTFSPHLSPCGIIFDKERALSGNFKGSGFLVFGNGGGMTEPFADGSGNSLAQIKLTYNPSTNNYKTTTTNIVKNFKAPLGVELCGNDIYVIEHFGEAGNEAGIYKVSFPNKLEIPLAAGNISIDGIGNDMDWNYASWQNLDNFWVDNVSGNENTMPQPDDISGRFKTLWKGNKIYVLAEIRDDILDGKMPGDNPLTDYPNYDGLQIFLDPNNSKAMHTFNNKAFNLHISNQGDVVDLPGEGVTNWNARLFNDVAKSKIVHNGTLHTWEVEITAYDETYNELLSATQNAGALVNLTANKLMGMSIAFNDRDGSKGNPVGRRYMIASNNVAGSTNNARNIPWQDASVFGQAILIGQPTNQPEFELESSELLLRNDKDSSFNIKIINMTDSKLIYNLVSPLPSFANVSVNGVSKTIAFNYSKTVTGTQILTVSGTNGFATTYKFLSVTAGAVVSTPSFLIIKPNVVIKSNRDSTITIPISSFSSNTQVRYTILPLVTFANLTINSITGTVTIKYIANKLGNGVFTITGTAGADSYSQTFTVSIVGTLLTSSNTPITENNNIIRIFPNPATNAINVQSEDQINHIKLINIHGVQRAKWNVENSNQIELNIESISKGFYFLHISTDKQTIIKKIIIQ